MAQHGNYARRQWITHLEALTRGVLEGVPFDAGASVRIGYIEEFRDEFGNRRGSDRAFLSHVLGVAISATRDAGRMGLDERLWWCVADGEAVPEGMLGGEGGLVADPDALAIEYRTMVELGALQALWAIALRDRDPGMMDRAMNAARWHIRELQPDNAINRPWGLAVFVELAGTERDESLAQTAELHAQTLLHNACINFGSPDLLSALVLKDNIDLLRASDQ